jgi:hypothetical protein
MEKIATQLIIIGSGYSLKEGIKMGLWNTLRDRFTLGINFIYRDFIPTSLCCIDNTFYQEGCTNFLPEQKEIHKNTIKSLPLIINRYKKNVPIFPNTIGIKHSSTYCRDLSCGCYNDVLAGLFTLSLGIYLLDVGEIYLLGYDFGPSEGKDSQGRALTHYNQEEFTHRGTGRTEWYLNPLKEKFKHEVLFAPYETETKVKIYNVSLNSRIQTFPKISYQEFFRRLSPETYNQNNLHQYIKEKLKDKHVK